MEEDKKTSFSYEELKEAFNSGSWVTSWSDWGITMKYDNFEEWFNEKYKNEKN